MTVIAVTHWSWHVMALLMTGSYRACEDAAQRKGSTRGLFPRGVTLKRELCMEAWSAPEEASQGLVHRHQPRRKLNNCAEVGSCDKWRIKLPRDHLLPAAKPQLAARLLIRATEKLTLATKTTNKSGKTST